MWNEIESRIHHAVHKLEGKIMSTFRDLADVLTGIAGDVTTVQSGVLTLNSTIETLKAQLAAAGTTLPVDAQASLDSAVSQGAATKATLDAIAAGFSAATVVATTAAAAAAPAPAPAPTA